VNVFDSSALLCFLRGEAGADVVERELLVGGACRAANWSEVAQTVGEREQDWRPSRALLLSYDLTVEPVITADAEAAARLWRRGSGLSLSDRLCLATAQRLDAVVWTADTAWGTADPVRQVR
jgi:PIN domain nuclease of toxin-antitoxin system